MTRAKFLNILAEHGAVLDLESEANWGALVIDAPKGKVFRANQSHSISEYFTNSTQSWKKQAFEDAAKRVSMGVDDCDIEDCDVCNDH